MNFYVYNQKSDVWVPAEGEVVEVAPHLRDQFAVHLGPLSTRWTITHVDTGTLVTFGDSMQDAIDLGRVRLARVTQEQMDRAVAKAGEQTKVPRPTEPPASGNTRLVAGTSRDSRTCRFCGALHLPEDGCPEDVTIAGRREQT